MRAWCVTSVGEPAEVFELQDIPPPEPGAGMLQIKVEAAGLGLPDVLMCRGAYAFSPELPYRPGQEIVGVISAVGEGVEDRVGERVMGVTTFYEGNGGFAEYCIAAANTVYSAPENISNEAAAGFTIPYHTAYIGLIERAALKVGETVVVLGAAGGTGIAAIRLATALGARVFAVASSDEKRRLCKSAGAEHCFDGASPELVAQILEANGGAGVDVVYDPVGGEPFQQSIEYCASGARILAVGFASGACGDIPTSKLLFSNVSVMGVYVGAYSHEQMCGFHAKLLALYDEGAICVDSTHPIAFKDIPSGLQQLADRKVSGKLVAQI